MRERPAPGFWRERVRGVGYLLLIQAGVLIVASAMAWLAVVVLT